MPFTIRYIMHTILYSSCFILLGIIIVYIPFIDHRGFVFSNQYDKSFTGICFIFILALTWSVSNIFNNKHVLRLTLTDVLLFIYFIYLIISYIFITKPEGVTHSFIELSSLASLYVVIRLLNRGHLKYILLFIMSAGTGQAVYGLLQLYGFYPSNHSVFKITGGFFNPGPFSGFLVPCFSIALALYLQGKQKLKGVLISTNSSFRLFRYNYKKIFSSDNCDFIITNAVYIITPLITIITMLLIIPITLSRAAWISMTVISAIILFKFYNINGLIEKYFTTGIKRFVFVLMIFILVTSSLYDIYQLKKKSADGRLLIWRTTLNMALDKPVAGHGYTKFKAGYMDYQADYFKKNPRSIFIATANDNNYAFNTFLKIFSETGAIGLFLNLTIIFFTFFSKREKSSGKDDYLFIIRMSLLSLVLFGMFSYPEEIFPIKILFVSLLAMLPSNTLNLDVKSWITQFVIPTALISTVIFLPVFYKFKKGFVEWSHAYGYYQAGMYELCLEDYEKAYPAYKNNGEFLINYGKALSMASEHKKAVEILELGKKYHTNTVLYTALGDSYKALKNYKKSENAYMQAHFMAPGKFYPEYLLAKLYDESGQKQKALIKAKNLLKKEVKVQSTAIEEIKNEMRKIIDKY